MSKRKIHIKLGEVLKLVELGVTQIRVDYSGGGDSGSVDGMIFYTGWDIKDPNLNEIINKNYSELVASIEEEAYHQLTKIGDWYNNEGGEGYLLIDIPELSIEINARFNREAPYDEETEEYDYENQESWEEDYSFEGIKYL